MQFGLLVEVVDDVSRHNADALRMVQCLVFVDAPHLLALHITFHLHGALIVHMESKHVLISDGIDNGVRVQRTCRLSLLVRLSTKQLCCRRIFATLMGIYCKDRCAGKSEHQILLESLGNVLAHITKLTPVTLVEYQHDVFFLQHLAQSFIVVIELRFHQVRQLLYRGNDDVAIVSLQLVQQHTGRAVRVGTVLFEVVILLHGLIVQILSIYHKQHLVDAFHL